MACGTVVRSMIVPQVIIWTHKEYAVIKQNNVKNISNANKKVGFFFFNFGVEPEPLVINSSLLCVRQQVNRAKQLN